MTRLSDHLVYKTKKGSAYCGQSEEVMKTRAFAKYKGNVQMIFTSPPFPLNRKKKYGNLKGKEYLNWIKGLAPIFSEYLKDDGSVVIELGNAWEQGRPVMSTLPMEALLAFKEAGELELCQEFVCFNPARLPSPAQWVNVERCRVKDSFSRVWWMAKSDRPKANNKNILTEYSDSMKKLLERGTYNSGRRPSQHVIGEQSFNKDHGGSIPPNVLVANILDQLPQLLEILPIANTRAIDPYRQYCNEKGLVAHPARMPEKLVEFFVRFLTDPEDLVLDPFAGSNVTGYVCEALDRKWLAIDAQREYVDGSEGRFVA